MTTSSFYLSNHGVRRTVGQEPDVADVGISRSPSGEPAALAEAPHLTVIWEGEEVHEVDGRRFRLRSGQMLLILNARERHATSVRGDRLPTGVRFPLADALRLAGHAQAVGPALIQTIATAEERRLVEMAASPRQRPCDIHLLESVCSGMVRDAEARLARLDVRKPVTRQVVLQRLEMARTHLHMNLDRIVPLDELAHEAGMSGFHLARHFMQAFGEPPARYHRSLRLSAAVDELTANAAAIGDIAFRFGYAELSAFTHAFRREYGASPQSVRRRGTSGRALAA